MLPEIAALFFAGRTLLACLHCCLLASCLPLTRQVLYVPGSHTRSCRCFSKARAQHRWRTECQCFVVTFLAEQQCCRSGQKRGTQYLLTNAAVCAGIDTTGHTGTWALYLLAQHPAVEARLAAELDAAELLVTAKRPHPRQLQWADLARLAYLQAVIKARPVPEWSLADVSLRQIRIGICICLHMQKHMLA